MYKIIFYILIVCIFHISRPTSSIADSQQLYGVNSRAIALGNAYTAVADDFSATFYNVGGLAQIDKIMLSFEFQITEDFLSSPYDSSSYYDIPNSHGFNLGVVIPFGKRVAFGFSMFLPVGYVSSLSMGNVYEPNYVIYENTTNTVSVLTGLSIEPVQGFSFGIGARSLGDLTSTVYSNTTFGEEGNPNEPNIQMTSQVGQKIAPIAGALLNFIAFSNSLKDLKLGMSYRHEIDINTDVTLNNDVTTAFDSGISLENTYQLNLSSSLNFVPTEYTLGVSYIFADKVLASMDVNYALWSHFISPGAYVEVADSSGGSLGEPSLTENPAAYFSDTINPKFGLEYRFNRIHGGTTLDYLDIAMRGGYAFLKSPVPNQDEEATYFLDSDKNIFSLGLGFKFKDKKDILKDSLSVDLHIQLHQLIPNYIEKSTDSLSDSSGSTSEGLILNTGATISYNY